MLGDGEPETIEGVTIGITVQTTRRCVDLRPVVLGEDEPIATFIERVRDALVQLRGLDDRSS